MMVTQDYINILGSFNMVANSEKKDIRQKIIHNDQSKLVLVKEISLHFPLHNITYIIKCKDKEEIKQRGVQCAL